MQSLESDNSTREGKAQTEVRTAHGRKTEGKK